MSAELIGQARSPVLDFGLAVAKGTDAESDAEAKELIYFNMILSVQQIERKHGPGVWAEIPRVRESDDGRLWIWHGQYLPDSVDLA